VEAVNAELRRERAPEPPRAAAGAWRGVAASFRFAWDGVVETALRQRNMRIHLVAGILVALLASAARLGAAEDLALALCVFLVLSAEVANSALEALVDLVTRERHDRARAAKDAGAGAVLVLAAGAAAVLAVVLVHAWPAIAARPRGALALHAALGVPLASAAAALLAPDARAPAADAALAVAGAALLAALAWCSEDLAFTGLAALLFAVCAGAARRRRRERATLIAGV
jgi:diacylglycerol kinase (ATP)